MRSGGSHGQPKGTWSDDSSMTLCLMESLTNNNLDFNDVCVRFLNWAENGYMTAHGEMFDIGRTTLTAIRKFACGKPPLECGESGEYDNGNGSLMRILPLAFYTLGIKPQERFEIVHNVRITSYNVCYTKLLRNEQIYYTVDKIQQAIRTKKWMEFKYLEYNPDKKLVYKNRGYLYEFCPFTTFWSDDRYYVVGYSKKHKKIATFRIDRRITSYNVCYTKLLRHRRACPGAGASGARRPSVPRRPADRRGRPPPGRAADPAGHQAGGHRVSAGAAGWIWIHLESPDSRNNFV